MGDSGKAALVVIGILLVAFFLLCYKPIEPPVIEPADSSFNGAFSVTPANFSIYKSQSTVALKYSFNLLATNFSYGLGTYCRFKIEDLNGILSKASITDWDINYAMEGDDCLNKYPKQTSPYNQSAWCVRPARYGADQKLKIGTTENAVQNQTYRIYLVAQLGLEKDASSPSLIEVYALFKEIYPNEPVKEILHSYTWLSSANCRSFYMEFYEVRYPIDITIL